MTMPGLRRLITSQVEGHQPMFPTNELVQLPPRPAPDPVHPVEEEAQDHRPPTPLEEEDAPPPVR
jgi:hypothetical protein